MRCPKNAEIVGGGLHRCEPLHYRIGIDRAGRIAVFRDTPHSFNRRIRSDEVFHFIHVRAVFKETDRNHADAIVFADFEVAITSRHWAEEWDIANSSTMAESYRRFPSAGRRRRCHASRRGWHCLPRQSVQAGPSAECRRDGCLDQSLQSAVVSSVGGVVGNEVARAGKGQKLGTQVELLGGSSRRQIELEPAFSEIIVVCL